MRQQEREGEQGARDARAPLLQSGFQLIDGDGDSLERSFHDDHHLRRGKTYYNIAKRYFWKSMWGKYSLRLIGERGPSTLVNLARGSVFTSEFGPGVQTQGGSNSL